MNTINSTNAQYGSFNKFKTAANYSYSAMFFLLTLSTYLTGNYIISTAMGILGCYFLLNHVSHQHMCCWRKTMPNTWWYTLKLFSLDALIILSAASIIAGNYWGIMVAIMAGAVGFALLEEINEIQKSRNQNPNRECICDHQYASEQEYYKVHHPAAPTYLHK